MNKATLISIVIALTLIGGTIFLTGDNNQSASVDNVKIIDGKQVISIDAKGGYFPRITNAKAGLPTVIKIKTENTFDCSLALAIPNIGFRENLQPSGETNIEIPVQDTGSVMRGTCSMGMYNFSVNFN